MRALLDGLRFCIGFRVRPALAKGEAPARGELTLKTYRRPYLFSFRAFSTLQSGPQPISVAAGHVWLQRASAEIGRQSINCGANYAFAETTNK